MGDMAKYSKSKTKNGKKEIDTFSNLIYNEHYVQVYQNTFDLMYDDLKNCKMRLFWFLIDRLSQSNYFYIGKKLRGEFSSECEKRGNSYNDIKVTAALTELKREGKLMSDTKGIYYFNPVYVWIGTADDRKEAIDRLHEDKKI